MDIPVGILIKARDAAKGVLQGVGAAGRTMGSALKDAGERAKAGLDVAFKGVTLVNQAMGIAQKVAGGLNKIWEMTIAKALEQRAAGDAQAKTFKELGLQFQRIAGLVGDIMIPAILGVVDALRPTIDASEKWLATNRELAGGKFLTWLQDVALELTTGVATSVVLVTRAWSGWQQIISVVQSLVSSGFALMLRGAAAAMGGIERVARAFGKDGLADSIAGARREVEILTSTFEDSSDVALAEAAREARAQEELERKIAAVEKRVREGIGVAAVAATKRLGQEIKKIPPNLAEIQKAAEERLAKFREALQKASDEVSRMIQKRTELYEREARASEMAGKLQQDLEERALEALKKRTQQTAERVKALVDSYREAFSAIRNLASDAFSDVGRLQNQVVIDIVRNEKGLLEEQERIVSQHVKTVGDAMGQLFSRISNMVFEIAVQLALTKAVEAIVNAYAGHAAIPLVGLALGAAAAGAIAGAITAQKGSIPAAKKFHSGGRIPGRPGEERLFVGRAGELVVREDRADAAVAAGFGPGAAGARADAMSRGGGGDVYQTINTLFIPSRTQMDRINRDTLAPSNRRLRRLRHPMALAGA